MSEAQRQTKRVVQMAALQDTVLVDKRWAPRLLTADEIGRLAAAQGNSRCADCSAVTGVAWASLGFAALVCAQCSGFHRALGQCWGSLRSIVGGGVL